MRPIAGIIVHHSAGPSSATVESIRRAHLARGWSDVGYHLLIREDPDHGWLIEGGRPLAAVGAHDEGQNTGTIGVCILGDYSTGPVPREAWHLLCGALAGLLIRYGLPIPCIEGHGENEGPGHATACPGFSPALLRRDVARLCTALGAIASP